MEKQTGKPPKGGAVSKPENPSTDNTEALVVSGDGDVSGPLSQALGLSRDTQDRLLQELQESLHQVSEGFGDLTKPGDIYDMRAPFSVIDAITIPDYVDQKTGEEKVKHIFKLELEDGRVLLTMQSDARPRRVLASIFTRARAIGAKAKAGPYLYEKKAITGQIQPAFIFVQQKGFRAEAYT